MSDYRKLVKDEAKAFYDAARVEFESDAADFGGKSDTPNFSRWIDETGRLTARIEDISSKWGQKDFLWVRTHTRSAPKGGGGDPKSNAFISFFQDVKSEIKKLAKSASS